MHFTEQLSDFFPLIPGYRKSHLQSQNQRCDANAAQQVMEHQTQVFLSSNQANSEQSQGYQLVTLAFMHRGPVSFLLTLF